MARHGLSTWACPRTCADLNLANVVLEHGRAGHRGRHRDLQSQEDRMSRSAWDRAGTCYKGGPVGDTAGGREALTRPRPAARPCS